MKTRKELVRSTIPAESGADFRAEREGGLARITPLTHRARVWLDTEISPEATWVSDSLVVEVRYFAGLADAIIDAGFTFERDPYVN